jgi:hypothetical protein
MTLERYYLCETQAVVHVSKLLKIGKHKAGMSVGPNFSNYAYINSLSKTE